ncbi:MAG: glucosamine-6-phosphate deaminase, partial [Lentisphaerae bacterium]
MSKVEAYFLQQSQCVDRYAPEEKMRCVIVRNFPELGRLTALRFLEWVQNNPGGVISLPTGKTPEYFIRFVQHYLGNWDRVEVAKELEAVGLDPQKRPQMGSLTFVQMDEFYPQDPSQHNSFCNYVRHYYLEGFSLDASRALLIDCREITGRALHEIWPDGRVDLSLRTRTPRTLLEYRQQEMIRRIDEWCEEYEAKIRALGGIGFFLGGIGPDGHVAFNMRGSLHESGTRLCETNYETQAAAATDLGGIEVARNKAVITIGLGTITRNPHCTAIIMAAGEAKAK